MKHNQQEKMEMATYNGNNTDEVLAELVERMGQMQARQRNRKIEKSDIICALSIIDEQAPNRVRVYSDGGFVPNAYKYRCDISYVEGTRQEDGTYTVIVGRCDAKRSRGNGSLCVVQGSNNGR